MPNPFLISVCWNYWLIFTENKILLLYYKTWTWNVSSEKFLSCIKNASINFYESLLATLANEKLWYHMLYVQSDVETCRPRSSWLIVLSSGCIPHPHRFLKSSKSRAQIIPPPRSILLMYCDCNSEHKFGD